MVRMLRRVARTEETPADPGYEALEWKRLQVLFPDWNPAFNDPHDENVEVYSNAAEVELMLNGRSLGTKATRKDGAPLNWSVPFAPGTLQAIARSDGKEVANDLLRTAGKAAKLRLLPDRKSLGVNWDEVSNIEVQVVDEHGVVVPNAADLIQFQVTGPGKLIAVDSGSVVSTEPFQVMERRAFQGRCLGVLRATGRGTVALTASAEGLGPATVEIAVP